ncbi:MAG: hypothetical protein HUK18_01765 [Bacteroidales bacterium]|mgnify:FL=1|nr:hypothetical protein [Bacteroidales bacterium]
MNNDNLNILKEKVREIYDLVISLQMPEEKKDEFFTEQRYNALMQRTEEIIAQNQQIISLAKNILEKEAVAPEPQVIEKVVEKVVEIKPTEQEVNQVVVEEEKQEIIEETTLNIEEKEIEDLKAELEKFVSENSNEDSEKEKQVLAEEKQEIIEPKQEEPSVLDFLKNRVYKEKTEQSVEEKPTPNLKDLIKPEPAPVKEEKQAEIPVAESVVVEKPKAQAELFSTENKPKSIADMFESKTRKSLSQSIGITFKFKFINDLFAGVTENYAQFIKKLNDAQSLQESMQIIEQTRLEKKWPHNSSAYNELLNFVEKRFEEE